MMWAFSLSAENLNTSFSELHISPLLWVWCPEPRPTTPLTLGPWLFSLPFWTFHRGARVCGFFSPESGGEGGSYRVLLQLQPLPVGKRGPSLSWVPVWGWGNGPCFLLHSEHLTAGLVFIVCALPSIDDPGGEARKADQTNALCHSLVEWTDFLVDLYKHMLKHLMKHCSELSSPFQVSDSCDQLH